MTLIDPGAGEPACTLREAGEDNALAALITYAREEAELRGRRFTAYLLDMASRSAACGIEPGAPTPEPGASARFSD